MVVSRKTNGMRDVCMARGETKIETFQTHFMSVTRIIALLYMRTFTGFSFFGGGLTSSSGSESVSERTPHRSSAVLQLHSFFSLWNPHIRTARLQPTVKIPWMCAKDDIHTHCFLNINHCAQPSWKTDVRHSGGPFQRFWLSVDTVYLPCSFYVFKWCCFGRPAFICCIDKTPEHLTRLKQYIFLLYFLPHCYTESFILVVSQEEIQHKGSSFLACPRFHCFCR